MLNCELKANVDLFNTENKILVAFHNLGPIDEFCDKLIKHRIVVLYVPESIIMNWIFDEIDIFTHIMYWITCDIYAKYLYTVFIWY